jgi:predicted amidohydrolase
MKLHVGYVQTNPLFGVKKFNFDQVRTLLKGVKADLIVLPELFATGYAFTSKEEVAKLSESVEDVTSKFLIELSNDTGAIIVAGFAEKDHNTIYNSSMVVHDNHVIGTYRKVHLYFKEKLWFTPGDKPPGVFEINEEKIGVMICFDWFFPETIRTIALQGASIIAHPANLVLPYCQSAMQTLCLVNRVYAITSNRIGREVRGDDDFSFTGGSQVTSYNGDILSSAPSDEMGVDIVEIEGEETRDKHLNPYNDIFKDRRSDLYKL